MNPELVALARSTALEHIIDGALVCAVCEQESSWNPKATRYEPGFRTRYVIPLQLKDAVEEIKRSTSFGLMQIMGQVAREFGYVGDLEKLLDPAVGLAYGCRKLRQCFDRFGGDETAALEHYNGGANPDYAKQVQARMPRYY